MVVVAGGGGWAPSRLCLVIVRAPAGACAGGADAPALVCGAMFKFDVSMGQCECDLKG